jgi:hypothetical protein
MPDSGTSGESTHDGPVLFTGEVGERRIDPRGIAFDERFNNPDAPPTILAINVQVAVAITAEQLARMSPDQAAEVTAGIGLIFRSLAVISSIEKAIANG